ncbi:hypothetical protein GEMRC1_004891 [Eukaryota sp. GEM-RC1]
MFLRLALFTLFLASISCSEVFVSHDGDDSNSCMSSSLPCFSFSKVIGLVSNNEEIDSIRILPGTYVIDEQRNPISYQGVDVNFIGSGSATTIIDCAGYPEHAFSVNTASATTVSGLTFQGCTSGVFSITRSAISLDDVVIQDIEGEQGSALLINDDCSVDLHNVHLSRVASRLIAPISATGSSTLTISSSSFTDCSGLLGGVINVHDSSLNVSSSSFHQTIARRGGAIFAIHSTINLKTIHVSQSHAILIDNKGGDGGAFYFEKSSAFAHHITAHNTSADYGGLFYVYDSPFYGSLINSSYSHAKDGGAAFYVEATVLFAVVESQFLHSEAGYNGGFWFFEVNNIRVSDVLFADNQAQGGSALFVDNCKFVNFTDVRMDRSTKYPIVIFGSFNVKMSQLLVQNSSSIFIESSDNILVENSFFLNNFLQDSNGGALVITKTGNVDVFGCDFNGNSAPLGGAIFYSSLLEGKFRWTSFDSHANPIPTMNVKVSNSSFSANKALAGSVLFVDSDKLNTRASAIVPEFSDTFYDPVDVNIAEVFGSPYASSPSIMNVHNLTYGESEEGEPAVALQVSILDFFDNIYSLPTDHRVTIEPDDSDGRELF